MSLTFPSSSSPSGRSGDPKPLGRLIDLAISDLGIRRKIAQYSACARWVEIVGPEVARVTTVESIEHGKLLIQVATPAWRTELRFLKNTILRKLNEAAGEHILDDIIFR